MKKRDASRLTAFIHRNLMGVEEREREREREEEEEEEEAGQEAEKRNMMISDNVERLVLNIYKCIAKKKERKTQEISEKVIEMK